MSFIATGMIILGVVIAAVTGWAGYTAYTRYQYLESTLATANWILHLFPWPFRDELFSHRPLWHDIYDAHAEGTTSSTKGAIVGAVNTSRFIGELPSTEREVLRQQVREAPADLFSEFDTLYTRLPIDGFRRTMLKAKRSIPESTTEVKPFHEHANGIAPPTGDGERRNAVFWAVHAINGLLRLGELDRETCETLVLDISGALDGLTPEESVGWRREVLAARVANA